MESKRYPSVIVQICVAGGLLFLGPGAVRGQERVLAASSGAPSPEPIPDARALSELVRELQSQVQALNSQLSDLRAEQQQANAQTHELREELDLLKARQTPALVESAEARLPSAPPVPPQPRSTEERLGKLEEDEQVMEGKIDDEYQTKVESGSKYRLRLSGIALLNLYENRGTLDNQDFPELAEFPQSQSSYATPGAFGGSLRQSQIRLQTFGPDVAGARTSADVTFDFAGALPGVPNGVAMGIVRLRTGIVRLDWANTSIIAGQDRLFFAPLAPTSLATVAVPALSYAGNLWAWTPQVRLERRVNFSDTSSMSFQGGILDNLTGDLPPQEYVRYPSWGEQSGQPAYAARISWSHRMFGQNFTLGTSGYYGQQNFGFNRTVDGWAGIADLKLPLGKRVEFTGEAYRGRAVAGIGGAIGQDVLLNGMFSSPATTIRGLDSMGGWAQLKIMPKSNFEINGALGLDNPFASEQRRYNYFSVYGTTTYSRNLVPLLNFIYQIRSDVLFSVEYRHLNTAVLDGGSANANHVNLSLGYIF